MWYLWTTLLLVSCALAEAEEPTTAAPATETAVPVATTRPPPRTLDRQAAELAWRTWLQSPESGNPNAPPRRITTKSLFITPLVCPKGQRLDRNGCVQVVTVNKDEHERILLEQLNALFTSAPSSDILYDYGDDEPGPLQLSIPIGLDPQAASLQSQEPSAQAQSDQPNYVQVDKKGENSANGASIEAELELLKLQQASEALNNTAATEGTGVLNHNVLSNLLSYSDKPKRDSPMVNSTVIETLNITDEGQKEIVYGHVNVDPVIYDTVNQDSQLGDAKVNETPLTENAAHTDMTNSDENKTDTNNNTSEKNHNSTTPLLKKGVEETKLNPENDYSDIGEAIKLISRYAEVSTDDNYTKDHRRTTTTEDSVLGTRTKLQYRKNKTKLSENINDSKQPQTVSEVGLNDEKTAQNSPLQGDVYYRYPWPNARPGSPPSNYPFRHLQDYWPGRNRIGGVYSTMHENPRRHHHSYPQYFRPRGYYGNYPESYSGLPNTYPGLQYPHRAVQHNASPPRSHANNQDLYTLLGLRHWFSSEGSSKR